jgi:hydrogenase large subunit
MDPRYRDVGTRPTSHIDPGFWDDAFAYDATYETCNDWGSRRYSTPGVVIDGELVTTRLTDINIGWEEFVDHAYYDEGATERYATDHLGNPISPYHPWNKRTLPRPGPQSWKDKYSWSTAPRWDRRVVESGAYSRLLMTAMAKEHPQNEFYEATGTSLRMRMPKGEAPEMEFEWHVPERWNCFERNRARAYHFAFAQLVSFTELLRAYDLYRNGETRVAAVNPDQLEKHIPKDERVSVGFWGAGRGWLTHHLVMDKGKIVNYQICTPSTINASPRDAFDQPGPYEEAVLHTPILEKFNDPSQFTSVDMLRAIRSFDPCMPCTTHVYTPQGTVTREVNTCACGADTTHVH